MSLWCRYYQCLMIQIEDAAGAGLTPCLALQCTSAQNRYRARGAGKALTAQLAKDWNLTAASQPGKNSPTLSLGLPCSMLLSATCSVNTPSVPEVINIIHLTQQLWLISQWWQRPPYSLQAHRKRGSDEARLTSKNCLGQCKHWPHYLEISLLSQLICKRVHPSLHCQAQNVITGHRGMNVSGKE